MGTEELGITNIKFALKAIIELGESLENALEDGKVSLAEAVSIAVDAVPDIIGVYQSASDLKAEYKDLSDAEGEELITYAAEELNLESDKVEEVIEKAFAVFVEINGLVAAIKGLKKVE